MKKIGIGVLSLTMLFAGGLSLTNSFSFAEEGAAPQPKPCAVSSIAKLQEALEGDYDVITLSDNINGEGVELNISKINEFAGTLDGDGYKITNLKIVADDGDGQTDDTYAYYGLLPQANGAKIKNLKLEGTLTYDLSKADPTGVVIGGLVGSGVNTSIENCELDLTKIQEVYTDKETGDETIRDEIHIDKSMQFGSIAGKLAKNGGESFVSGCLAYYSTGFYFDKLAATAVGGLVGDAYNTPITNSLSFGDITYNGTSGIAAGSSEQYFGGIAGSARGVLLDVRNTIHDGNIVAKEDVFIKPSTTKVGAIVGGVDLAEEQHANNVRYNYFTQSAILPVGDGEISIRENLQQLQQVVQDYTTINKDVLSQDIFDTELDKFNFETVWDYKNSKVSLQQFETFNFEVSPAFDASPEQKAIKKATFKVDGVDGTEKDFRYGKDVKFKVELKNWTAGNSEPNNDMQAVGWFHNLQVFKNTRTGVSVEYDNYDADAGVWEFTLKANASTAGQYSFSVTQKPYEAATVETANSEHGGVRTADASSNHASEKIDRITFSYANKTKEVVAVPKGAYAFDHWEMYQKTEDGWSSDAVAREEDGTWKGTNLKWKEQTLTLEFDPTNAVLKNGFKVVAVFTADPAKVNFVYDEKQIAGVSLAGVDHIQGEIMLLAKTGVVSLRITVKKGFELNVDELKKEIIEAVQNPKYEIPVTFQSDSVVDSEGNTTYVFNVDMEKFAYDKFAEGIINIDLTAQKAQNSNGNNLLWLWITLPIVVVVAAGVVVLIILLRRRNQMKGGRGRGGKDAKKGKTTAAKPKSESYKDYYV